MKLNAFFEGVQPKNVQIIPDINKSNFYMFDATFGVWLWPQLNWYSM